MPIYIEIHTLLIMKINSTVQMSMGSWNPHMPNQAPRKCPRRSWHVLEQYRQCPRIRRAMDVIHMCFDQIRSDEIS